MTRWTFVAKVMSLLSNMLSRLVLAFLSRRKHLLTLKGDNGTISSWVALLPFTALKPKLQNKILCWQTNAEPNLRNQWIREACLCPHTVLSSSATKHPPVSHQTSLTKHKFKEKVKNFKMVTWDHETSSRRLFWAPGPLCATVQAAGPWRWPCLEDILEKAMAPYSSTLAWKIPWTEEPGGLPSMGSHRVGHDWSDLAAVAAAQDICMHAKLLQLCLTLCNPMDCSLPVSSVCGIRQVRILEWVSMPSSRWIFLTQGLNLRLLWCLHCRQILNCWATGEAMLSTQIFGLMNVQMLLLKHRFH